MAASASLLDLTVLPYQPISQEDAKNLSEVNIKVLFGFAKKPKKSTAELLVVIESLRTTNIVISGEYLRSIREWYNFFPHACSFDTRYLMFY